MHDFMTFSPWGGKIKRDLAGYAWHVVCLS